MTNTKFMTRTVDGRKLDFMFSYSNIEKKYTICCVSAHNYKSIVNGYLAEMECPYYITEDYKSFLSILSADGYYTAWWNEYVCPYEMDCCQMWDDDENNTCGEYVELFGFGDDVDYDFMNKVGNKSKELAKLFN